MPFVHVMTWPAKDENQIIRLQEDITFAVHKNTGAPLDKISVVVSEIAPSAGRMQACLGRIKIFLLRVEEKLRGIKFA